MTTHHFPVVLTTQGAAADNEDVVGDNVSVVNEMYQALLNADEIAPNALRSYFVDFYLTQALDGGFAQYVFMTPDREELDAYIREGFEAMGAKAHLELFNRTAALYDLLSEQDTEAYLEDEDEAQDERSEGVIAMEELDNEFEELFESEDVTGLNAQWLRGQEGLLILDAEELEAHIATRVATVTDLEARRAEAALEDAPEFELVIRELCSVAGHELLKITMGDPNFEHNGATVLAWHFTTNKGEFLMIDDDEEAVMLDPISKEIIATVEFELEDELAEA
ncbi:hypothetical protein CVS30_06605 [Arthrobacter psychrolactophilus]|uniref:DNA mimic protein DMP19 C-terminal domain-containing protein n=1 Tax=Arthrobacter psychrolactophilus TaxID=92442 RepID=A0A2V5J7W1_9MICC|nr:hypothetical protein [Arthrobacter psychrolactophilus]PYI38980.1 hypothetical protein CVS30_06605 [Arthrobacter psychrolactophilus]